MNLAGTIPGWTRFPPAQELLDKAARARAPSIRRWRGRRRRARHPTIRSRRSGCFSNSWSGASRSGSKPLQRASFADAR